MNEFLEKLDAFIEERIKEQDDSYAKWYKKSKYYHKPTIEEVFGALIGADIINFREAIKNDSDLTSYIKEFEETAKRWGASWYDEDLDCDRSGYEWESKVYVFLRNIAAESIGENPINLDAYYEGYGEA